jgi:hypothetical protein
MDTTTYILTAEMDGASFAWLDDLRRRHFPAARNFLQAHLTMFHTLSSAQADRLAEMVLPHAQVDLHFQAPVFLGAGVAIKVRSPNLEGLRDRIKRLFGGDATRQDFQRWSPHVTVQNKVHRDEARNLFRELTDEFAKRSGSATGLLLWEYLGGPWRLERRYPFVAGAVTAASPSS